nr:thiamine phosphate synthase [Lentibacillus sp. Marseille-P4043]
MNQTFSQNLRKYLIMGSQNCEHDPVEILQSAISAGITAFQFREKGEGALKGNEKLRLGHKLREVCTQYHIPFIVNDDIELVYSLEADGIHVGQEDKSVEELRRLFPHKIIGLSVSNLHEVSTSPIQMVDYIGAGPVFNTTSKPDAKFAVGLEWITTLRERFLDLPICGIGGITTQNSASVIEAGANGVAVISAITKAKNIEKAVGNL